jgi:hypothetical protein
MTFLSLSLDSSTIFSGLPFFFFFFFFFDYETIGTAATYGFNFKPLRANCLHFLQTTRTCKSNCIQILLNLSIFILFIIYVFLCPHSLHIHKNLISAVVFNLFSFLYESIYMRMSVFISNIYCLFTF